MAHTQTLIKLMIAGETDETQLTHEIANLVRTLDGARGFFVTYLTNTHPCADNPSPAVLQGLRTAPDTIASLLVKNLAMSTAMAITHHRHQNPEMAAQSEQVSHRTATLIKRLGMSTVETEAENLWQGLTQGTGPYISFLARWGYDQEQRQTIQAALSQTFAHLQPSQK